MLMYDVRMMADERILDVQLLDHPVRYEPFATFPQPAGGECVFLGRTRVEEHPEHGRLVRLSYEAYEPLAMAAMRQLADQAVANHDCLAVRLHHTIGDVPPGEASVLVQVAGGHRGSVFDACRFLIDALKERVPIWKREVWEDGSTWAEGTPARGGGDR